MPPLWGRTTAAAGGMSLRGKSPPFDSLHGFLLEKQSDLVDTDVNGYKLAAWIFWIRAVLCVS